MARVYPGVILKVEEMMPASTCEGKFAKQEILTGINGTALKGLDSFVAMGNALTKAEATDGKMVFDVTSADGKTQRKETVTIPVLGAYSKTWPLDCPKSKRIIADVLIIIMCKVFYCFTYLSIVQIHSTKLNTHGSVLSL